MSDLGLTKRNEILARALLLESLTSSLIGGLLGIKNIKNSKTLGHKGSSISLNNKIDLLIDLDVLNSIEKKKFQTFMEIRNQFMHNIEASTFEKCLTYTDKKEAWLLNTFPSAKHLKKENQLEYSVLKLADEVLDLTSKILENLKQKFYNDAVNETAKKSNQAFVESVKEAKFILDNYIKKQIDGNKSFNSNKLKGFGTFTSKLIFSLWQKKFTELTKK